MNKNNYIIYKEIPFYKLLQEELVNINYTGLYIAEETTKKYIFKSEDELYYYINMQNNEVKLLMQIYKTQLKNQKLNSIIKQLSIKELATLFSKYGNKLKFDSIYININNTKEPTIKNMTKHKRNIKKVKKHDNQKVLVG